MTTSNRHFRTDTEIMVVEDNPWDIQFLSQILTKAGYKVRPASDGELALRSVQAKLPDLILLDVKLPGMNGVEVCRRLKADPETTDIPIIFISALGRADLKVTALEEGGVDYVTKPFEPAEVLARIDTHLKIHRLHLSLVARSEELLVEIEARKRAEKELQNHRSHLEALVKERTAALREREEKYKSLFQSSFDGIAESTLAGRLISCNPAYTEMTGRSVDEFKNISNQDVTAPKWIDIDKKHVKQCLERGYSDIYEKELIKKDGSVIPISIRIWLRKTVEGKPVSLWGIVQDITERKQAEDALRRSELQFRLVTETIKDVFWMSTYGTEKVVYISPAYESIWERTTKSLYLSPKSFLKAIHPDDLDEYFRVMDRYKKNGKPYSCEYRIKSKDGTVKWIFERGYPTAESLNGSPLMAGICTDITNRKQAEEALRQSERKNKDAQKLLQLVLDTIPVRLFWKDLDLTFLGCNRLFAEDAGYQAPEELIGSNDFSMVWKDQAEKYRQDDFDVIRSGTAKLNFEEIQTTPAGNQIWLSTSKVPLRDASNGIIGVLGAYEDITQRKWTEEELLKAQKLESLGRLAGGIAHDFNNFLMSIMGNISFAKMMIPQEDKSYIRLDDAEKACLRAKELTHQFLTFTKGGAPVKITVSVAQLLKNYGQLSLSGAKSICNYTIPDDLWNINADGGQIGQVLTNILINADQSMQDGGVIEVQCENVVVDNSQNLPLKNGKYVKISVKDQGPGIPKEALGKIFDPYFSTKKTGRGLGLASAYSIINRHEGHLAVESTSKSGTTFSLFLPTSISPLPLTETGKPSIFPGTGKILVMDDNVMVLGAVEAMLENLGYDVELAENGDQAVERYTAALQTARPFDLTIMDLIVPGGMGGAEAIGKLLEIDPLAKTIVSSGYSNDPIMADYKGYGFSGVLVKPYRLEELSEQIRQVLHE